MQRLNKLTNNTRTHIVYTVEVLRALEARKHSVTPDILCPYSGLHNIHYVAVDLSDKDIIRLSLCVEKANKIGWGLELFSPNGALASFETALKSYARGLWHRGQVVLTQGKRSVPYNSLSRDISQRMHEHQFRVYQYPDIHLTLRAGKAVICSDYIHHIRYRNTSILLQEQLRLQGIDAVYSVYVDSAVNNGQDIEDAIHDTVDGLLVSLYDIEDIYQKIEYIYQFQFAKRNMK